MSLLSLQTLSFHWLLYPAREVWKWLDQHHHAPAVDFFVFDLYFPASPEAGRPILLCCFAHNPTPGFYNPDNPDVLLPYESNALLLNGPIQMSVNQISAKVIREILGDNQSDEDYLLFVPNLDMTQRIYYNIFFMKRTATGDVIIGDSVSTNPSPPATL